MTNEEEETVPSETHAAMPETPAAPAKKKDAFEAAHDAFFSTGENRQPDDPFLPPKTGSSEKK